MKILVEHEVPCEKGMDQKCLYPGDYCGNDVCRYHTHRDRTHGRKAPVERHLPKCTLFDEWLPGEYLKCEKCMASVTASRRSHEPIPLKELREMNEPTPVWWAEAGFWCLIQNGILTAPSGMSAQVNEMSGTFYFCQPEEG